MYHVVSLPRSDACRGSSSRRVPALPAQDTTATEYSSSVSVPTLKSLRCLRRVRRPTSPQESQISVLGCLVANPSTLTLHLSSQLPRHDPHTLNLRSQFSDASPQSHISVLSSDTDLLGPSSCSCKCKYQADIYLTTIIRLEGRRAIL